MARKKHIKEWQPTLNSWCVAYGVANRFDKSHIWFIHNVIDVYTDCNDSSIFYTIHERACPKKANKRRN